VLLPDSKAAESYGAGQIAERHRHRYELNNAYRQQFEAHGLRVVGSSPDGKLAEIIELSDHPWFVAVQFHPEFRSKPTEAHPLFAGFVAAAVERHFARGERAKELQV
jgi:CTP synthase